MTMLAVEQWKSFKTAKNMYLITHNYPNAHALYKQTGARSLKHCSIEVYYLRSQNQT